MNKIFTYLIVTLIYTTTFYCSGPKQHTVLIGPGCRVDSNLTILLPPQGDFTFACNKDYTGKGPVTIKADPKTGKSIEIYTQTPSSNAAVSQQKFSDAIIELFTKNNLGSITKKTPLDIHFPTQTTLLTGYTYKPTSDDLAGKSIYILIRYYNENNQKGIRFYRSLDRPGSKKDTRKSRALWTEFWSIEGVLSEEDQKNTKITILPNGNCEINLPGWLPIVLPLGTKELTFKSQVKAPLKS